MDRPIPEPLIARATRIWPTKLAHFAILVPVWTICYFLPQKLQFFPTRQLPLGWIDRIVPFEPAWMFHYMSMYLLLPIPPILTTTIRQIRRYVLGMMIMFATAAVFFFLIPVEYPRPATPDSAPAFYRLIASVDRPINSIPSLHAGLTAYALFFGARLLADLPPRRRRFLLTLGWIWAAIILYATLATKQHYFIDLPPGILLAWLSHTIACRALPDLPQDR